MESVQFLPTIPFDDPQLLEGKDFQPGVSEDNFK